MDRVCAEGQFGGGEQDRGNGSRLPVWIEAGEPGWGVGRLFRLPAARRLLFSGRRFHRGDGDRLGERVGILLAGGFTLAAR